MTHWIRNWFSNMLPCDRPIIDDMMIEYPTVENFYQAQKFRDPNTRKLLAGLTPAAAKKTSRTILLSEEELSEFAKIKLLVMEEGLRQKFAPNTTWRDRLLASDGDIIEWNNWGDTFWGRTTDGKGENHLGKILMKLRSEYKKEAS